MWTQFLSQLWFAQSIMMNNEEKNGEFMCKSDGSLIIFT